MRPRENSSLSLLTKNIPFRAQLGCYLGRLLLCGYGYNILSTLMDDPLFNQKPRNSKEVSEGNRIHHWEHEALRCLWQTRVKTPPIQNLKWLHSKSYNNFSVNRMPYTEAVIAETLRLSSIFPTGVLHKVLADTEFKGYFLPKDTIISHNTHYIHHDPELWGDPENFRPERFLSRDEKRFKRHEALMPFSTGKRQCLGEVLARDSLFLFSTNMLQRFTLEFDHNGPDNGYEPEISFILTPKPFHVIFRDRIK